MTKTNLKKAYSARIKAWKVSNPKVARGTRISPSDKAEAVHIASLARQVGEPHRRAAKRLGISESTLCRWVKRRSAIDHVTPPVTVRLANPQPKATIELTLPSGVRVTGITAADAVELLKELG